MSGSSFTNIFGGAAVRPAQPSFLAYALVANAALVWPLESTEGTPSVAAMINVTPAAGSSFSLAMPPGDTGSVGVQSMVTNVGADNFTLTDEAGNLIAIIAPTQSWLVALTDNSTITGTWSALQLASTTSTATSGSLAGPGLVANGALLETNWATTTLSASVLITASYRSTNVVWQGVTGTLQLDSSANLTPGWFCAFSNDGTGPVTITGSGGETINGGSSIVLNVGNSGFIICATGAFYSLGALPAPLNVVNGGTGASTTEQALTNFGGTAIGQSIFTAPNASAVVSLLGLTSSLLTESTIATNQTLAANASGTAYACTAALTLTLPLTTTLTPSFLIAAVAVGGAVTLAPQATDGFLGGAGVGASYTLPVGSSAMFLTDAAGTWIPVFAALPLAGGVISGNLTVGGTLAVTGATALTGALNANGGINLPTGASLTAQDSSSTVRQLLNITTGLTDIWNVSGGEFRILNQAGTAVLFESDNSGNFFASTGIATAGQISATGVILTSSLFEGAWQTYDAAHSIHFGWNGHVNIAIDGAYVGDAVLQGTSFTGTVLWAEISGIPALCLNNGATYGISISGNAATATSATTAIFATGATQATNLAVATGHALSFTWGGGQVLDPLIDGTSLGTLAFTVSDYRLKANIRDTSLCGMNAVMRLRPVDFEFQRSPGVLRLGMIAHEVADIIPEAVDRPKDAEDENGILPQGIDPLTMIAVLVKAVQELTHKVAALEARI